MVVVYKIKEITSAWAQEEGYHIKNKKRTTSLKAKSTPLHPTYLKKMLSYVCRIADLQFPFKNNSLHLIYSTLFDRLLIFRKEFLFSNYADIYCVKNAKWYDRHNS